MDFSFAVKCLTTGHPKIGIEFEGGIEATRSGGNLCLKPPHCYRQLSCFWVLRGHDKEHDDTWRVLEKGQPLYFRAQVSGASIDLACIFNLDFPRATKWAALVLPASQVSLGDFHLFEKHWGFDSLDRNAQGFGNGVPWTLA